MSVVTWKKCSNTGSRRPTVAETRRPPTNPPRASRAKLQPIRSAFRNWIAVIEMRFAAATNPPMARRTVRARTFPTAKIPAREPTSAKRVNAKLWPMRTPAPTAFAAAKTSAGPMPETSPATMGPAANGSA